MEHSILFRNERQGQSTVSQVDSPFLDGVVLNWCSLRIPNLKLWNWKPLVTDTDSKSFFREEKVYLAHNYRLESIMGGGEEESRQQNHKHLVTSTIKSIKIINVYVRYSAPFLHSYTIWNPTLGIEPPTTGKTLQLNEYNQDNPHRHVHRQTYLDNPSRKILSSPILDCVKLII